MIKDKFINLCKKIKNNKAGESVLLWVVLALIAITGFQGHVNILNQSSVLYEIQQQMDVSGLNALNSTIDLERLRKEDVHDGMTEEEFEDEYSRKIDVAFRKELTDKVHINDAITSLDIKNVSIEPLFTNEGAVGEQHILLDAIVKVTLSTFGTFNTSDGEELEFEVGKNGNTKITSVIRNPEGEMEIYLQNQTRLKY